MAEILFAVFVWLWLVLICYERTVLLTGWQLVAGASLVRENSNAGWLADKPNEQSESIAGMAKGKPTEGLLQAVGEK